MRVLGFLGNDIAGFVEGENRLDNVGGVIDELQQVHILRVYQALPHEGVAKPIEQAGPELRAHQNDGDADRKSTRLNSSHVSESRMPSSA